MATAQPSPELRSDAPSESVFATGTAEEIVKHVCEESPYIASGSDRFWINRATGMLTVVVEALVWLRDEGMVDIDVPELREFIQLKRVMDLADQDKFPDMPEEIRGNVKRYLETLPAYDGTIEASAQEESTREHHAFMNVHFAKALET